MDNEAIDAHTIYLAAAYAITALLVLVEVVLLRVRAAKIRRRENA
jgi:hypothetical protein